MQKSDFQKRPLFHTISHKLRDRVGGHQCNLNHEWTKANRKKLRRQHVEAIILGMQEYHLMIEAQIEEQNETYGFENFFDDYYREPEPEPEPEEDPWDYYPEPEDYAEDFDPFCDLLEEGYIDGTY